MAAKKLGFTLLDSDAKMGPALPIAICRENGDAMRELTKFRDLHDRYKVCIIMLLAFETTNFLFFKKKVLYFQLITITIAICALGRVKKSHPFSFLHYST